MRRHHNVCQLPIDVATTSRRLQKEGMHCSIAAKNELLTNAQRNRGWLLQRHMPTKTSNGGGQSSLVMKTFGWDFIIFEMVLYILFYI
jgi:hypothetical protein